MQRLNPLNSYKSELRCYPRVCVIKDVDARHKVYTWTGRRPDPSAGHDSVMWIPASLRRHAFAYEFSAIDPAQFVFLRLFFARGALLGVFFDGLFLGHHLFRR